MVVALLVAGVVRPAGAQVNDGTPESLEGVGIDEKLDAQLPMDLTFVDEKGQRVKLGDYFRGDRPVILNLVYFGCPMLCNLILNGMVESLREVQLDPAEDFEIVTVSFEPLEDHKMAARKKESYVREYGRSSAARGWHFLTGDKESIRALTDAVGFRYRWNEEQQEWAHPSTIIICTPEGHVSRYLGGILFEPKTVRLSLVEASRGRIGSLFDQVFLTCFHYTSGQGKYTANVYAIVRMVGVATVVVLAGTIGLLWRHEVKRRRRRERDAGAEHEVAHA